MNLANSGSLIARIAVVSGAALAAVAVHSGPAMALGTEPRPNATVNAAGSPYYYSGQGYSADYSAAFNYASTDARAKLARYVHDRGHQVSCGDTTLLRTVPIDQSGIWKVDVHYRATCKQV
ncbi:hypothetical protein [Lentzea albida]|uniref:DUF732 domain-containing protein n=1 Tax=Lentzea albida TaxID=65499 RepID=A0A1H9WSQ6_9PSEU|nr:hypothetical protein [Lentzea albida]SES36982.1 hypothetical protein SAMN04488000_12483 [Lentzea albida]